jgi:L-threonylcarbamoyladenylate synthase
MGPDSRGLARAASLLRSGRLVAFPTETVYGLGADATDEAAVRSIFAAKGRPADNPLIVHVAAVEGLWGVTVDVAPRLVRLLADHFWPGPLTLVVPRGPAIPPIVTAGRETVAVRVPGHPFARELVRECGRGALGQSLGSPEPDPGGTCSSRLRRRDRARHR